MLTHDMIDGVEESTARRVLAYALTIAPCLATVTEEEPRETALSILTPIARDIEAAPGFRLARSQSVGSARVDYRDVAALFTQQDKDALRALCNQVSASGLPQGSFPLPSKALSRMWPEDC